MKRISVVMIEANINTSKQDESSYHCYCCCAEEGVKSGLLYCYCGEFAER